MDTKIRTLLQAAQKYGVDEGGTALQQSYELLRNVAETRPSVDTPDAFSQDLYVICAETAFQHGKPELARECLKMYFMKTPPNNQFLCRAYLCQAQLLAPTSADNPDQLEKAVVYLIKAINMSKENQRYHFLVYNASVLYWQFCRPFLKPNYRQYLARSLHQVVKALDDIEDKDYEWRAQLMIALIECHMDAGRKSDASHIATAAASFIKQYVPNLYKTVFGLLVRHQLVDVTRLQKEIKASSELNVYYKICRLKLAIEQKDPDKDIGDEMRQLVSQISGQGTREVTFSGKDRDRSRTPDDSGSLLNSRSRSSSISSAAGSASRSTHAPKASSNLVAHKTSSGNSHPRSPSRQLSRQSPTQGKKQPLLDTPEKPHLLLELGRLALEQNLPDVAQQCVNLIKDVAHLVKDPSFFLQVEFMQSELMVRSLGNKQEHYTKPVVDIRLQAIKRCDEAIINALRQSNPSVLQAGCVTQWNLCLALLQTNLRHHVRRPLTTVADALHSIQSLLVQLRCQVHMELAKCEEDVEQIEVAMDHLKKALALDDGNVYNERLIVALHRLELRAELYTQPERPEDQAAMIIEQARKADSGTIRMKRSLLVRAGQALAPDAFLLVLESESDTKEKNRSEVSSGKGPLTQMRKLAGKAQQYNKCVKKAAGHLRRLGDENDRERAKLWADLAKTARKQEVWDVCRIACRFCLLYDDGRWKNEPLKTDSTPRLGSQSMAEDVPIRERSSLGKVSVKDKESKETVASRPASPEPTVPLYDKDLIRTIAEVNFINGESMIHLVRSEGVELGNKPIPPEDKSKRPKGYVAKKPEEDPDWLEYCEWIASLCDAAINSFLRGVELGIELQEAWIMCCAAAYIWNYNNHILSENRHSQIVEILQKVLDGLKQVGHAGETALLVNISNGLAIGLMQPWLPAATPRDVIMPSPPPGPRPGGDKSPTRGSAKRRGAAPQPAKSKPTLQVSISSEATPDIKRALEVCEYAMSVTNGDNPEDVVPIAVRLPLLQTWVRAKQMMQSQINRNFGIEEEGSQEGQNPMTQAMVTVEMLSSNNNGILEFKECPTLIQTVEMVEACKWTDRLIELQLWTKLTFLGFEAKDHAIVVKCAMKALQFAESSTQPRKRSDPHKYIVEQEMLSYASSIYGQSLVENAHGKNSARRQAMVQFLDSARFACNANNGDLVMTAARHYWNAALPLISQPIERELLQRPLSTLLQCITDTTDKKKYKRDEGSDEEDEDKKPMKQASIGGIPPVDPSGEAGQGSAGKPSAVGIIGGPEDDLTLRASLYGVLFQSYADKGEWEAGLRAMDQAIADMPRTNHRLLIFKHMVMTKAKLGLNVHMSIHKFKECVQDESEDYVAHMWRRVALASRDTQEQLQAYQNAIEALTSADSEWLKYEYLLEFGQWMYCNEFPLQDVLNQIQWGADILLNMKFEVEQKKEAPIEEVEEDPDTFREVSRRHSTHSHRTSATSTAKSKKGKGKKDRTSSPPPTGGRGKKGSVSKRPDPSDTKKPVDEAKKIEAEKEIKPDDAESINAADYVPVKKDIIIGVAPVNLGLTFAELCNIQQLDGLFRSHILMAQISGRASHNFADYCLMAYGFIMRMWQVSMPASGPVVKELAKNPPPEPAHGKSSAKGTKGKKDKSAELIKDKPKRKGPLDALPSSTEEWAGYDIPDEVLEAFKQDAMKTSGINAHSIPKPALTFYYLHLLTNELRKLGYNHLALPVLAMADALARALIKDRSLIALVHIRSLEVCLELNLLNGANFHEKLSEFKINEEDQAKCREEIVIWKEKQVQVAKEEVRIREAMAKYAGSAAKRSQAATSRQKAGGSTKPEESTEGVAIHLGKVIGAVQMRDVWASTAELLINHGLYQPAREMLNEAHLAAQAFDDKDLVVRVLHQLAKLAYLEAQYGQTVNLCTQAQRQHSGDEEFWYNTTMLMVDATLADYELKNRHKQARGILQNALNVFAEVAEMRPTKQSINGFILAKLEAKLGSVMVAVANEEKSHASKPKTVSALLTACKHLRHGEEQLLKLGYEREALHIYKERAAVLWQMAQEADTEAEKHDLFIQALAVYGEACSLADQLMYDIHTLVSIQDLDAVSLPIDREYAEIKLLCCELMNDMLCQHVDEVKASGAAKLRKGSIVRAVEELVVETPNYTPVEREWIDTTKVLGERIMVMLTTIHSLTSPIPQLRARILYNIGRCMRLLSVEKDPDQQIIWNMQEMNMLNMAQQIQDKGGNNEENEPEEGGHPEENPPPSRQSTKYSTLLCKLKGDLSLSHQYLVQATECLTQAVNLALSKALTKTAGLAALELVDCIGQLDPGLATQYLALYQSCASSQYLEGLMMKALVDPTLSQQAALFHQKKNLMANDVSSNASRGPVLRTLLASINDNSQSHAEKDESTSPNRIPTERSKSRRSVSSRKAKQNATKAAKTAESAEQEETPTDYIHCSAWRRLMVTPNHLDILKEFPPNFNFVILQHSPDRKYLYGAVLDKPRAADRAAGGGKSQKKDMLQASSKSKVVRVETKPEILDDILSRFKLFKHDVMQLLLRKEYVTSQQAQRDKMLANIQSQEKTIEQLEVDAEMQEEEDRLHEVFCCILQDMEMYLQPVTALLETALRPASATTVSNDRRGGEPLAPQEYVVLLADALLMELPLEALVGLQSESIVSLSREVSLQMLHHKMNTELSDESSEKTKKDKEKSKPPSRIPGLRDASKKQSKIIPLDRPVPGSCLPVDTHAFRYMVDPCLDCSETEEKAPIEVFNVMLEEHSQQFTPRWLGVMGNEHTPSAGEYEIYVMESSAFAFYGMERFMCYLPPHKVAALNLTDCQMVMLFDMAQTNKSFYRQSKIDVLKTEDMLSLEKPVETALLLALTGIKSVCLNQWHCTLAENADKINVFMKDLLASGLTNGQTVRLLQTPYRRKIPEEESPEDNADSQSNKADEKPEKGSVHADTEGGDIQSEAGAAPEEPLPEPVPTRTWYNMVVYGVPNLMITQLSKQ